MDDPRDALNKIREISHGMLDRNKDDMSVKCQEATSRINGIAEQCLMAMGEAKKGDNQDAKEGG